MDHRITLPDDLSRLKVGDKLLEFWILQGEAVGSRTRSETYVTSSRNGNGQVTRVDSEVVNYSDFYLRFDTGSELSVELPENSSFRVRDGHPISLVCMRVPAQNPKKMIFVGVRNRATGESTLLYSHLLLRSLAGLDKAIIQGLANLFVLVTLGLGLIPITLIGWSLNQKYGVPLANRVRDIMSSSLAT
jgi:hypothetical protein